MKQINDRIFLEENPKETRIEITQQIEKKKMMLLYLWLASWIFCGIVFIYSLITIQDGGEKLYFGVLVGAWAFICFRIVRVTLWRIIGKEILVITADKIFLKNAYGSFGKNLQFNRQHVQNIKTVKGQKNTFFQFMENSFWILGNNKFEFKFMKRTYQFGKQLEINEVKSLKRILEKAMRKNYTE